jgi:hypothetical protein
LNFPNWHQSRDQHTQTNTMQGLARPAGVQQPVRQLPSGRSRARSVVVARNRVPLRRSAYTDVLCVTALNLQRPLVAAAAAAAAVPPHQQPLARQRRACICRAGSSEPAPLVVVEGVSDAASGAVLLICNTHDRLCNNASIVKVRVPQTSTAVQPCVTPTNSCNCSPAPACRTSSPST